MRRCSMFFMSFLAVLSWAQLPQSSQLHQRSTPAAAPQYFKAAGQNARFEWFFLLIDAGQGQGIWEKNGIDPEWMPTPGSAAQLKEQVASGIKIGFVNTAEVLLARSSGVPVRVVAGYFGPTIAKIFVKADGPLKTPKDL